MRNETIVYSSFTIYLQNLLKTIISMVFIFYFLKIENKSQISQQGVKSECQLMKNVKIRDFVLALAVKF